VGKRAGGTTSRAGALGEQVAEGGKTMHPRITEAAVIFEAEEGDSIEEGIREFSIAMGELVRSEGFVLPVHIAVLGANGCGYVGSMLEGGETRFLMEHLKAEGCTLPVHCLLMENNSGRTARIILRQRQGDA
jgi:hypothetical protein